MNVLEWRAVLYLQEGYFGVLLNKIIIIYEINNETTLDWAHKQFVMTESIYIILFLTQHNKCINDDKNDYLHISTPCLTRSVYILQLMLKSIADDITMTRQLWCEHVKRDI